MLQRSARKRYKLIPLHCLLWGLAVPPAAWFHFDKRKSERLRVNPKSGIEFEEAQESSSLVLP
jgi:hypothetical protein